VPSRNRRGRAVFVTVFLAVLLVRGAYLVSLSRTPLSLWNLWTQTDEWGYLDWSAHLAAGNWRDVPAWRSYFGWQRAYGSPEEWEGWYQKNAYFSGPLYPYGLAVLRLAFGSPVWPARILQLLLACLASATLALAVLGLGEEFFRRRKEEFLRKGREGGAPAGGEASLESGARAAFWCALVAGVLYGLYGPLVFHDGFVLRDGPVAHLSTLLLAWPLIAREKSEENEKEKEISSKGEEVTPARGGWMRRAGGAFLLGLLGGLAILLKQTTAPLAVASLYCFYSSSLYSPSKQSPGGREGGRSSGGAQRRRRIFLFGIFGLAIPLAALAARNISAGVPPLTFDTRQAIGLVWGNARGADATTMSPPGMNEMLDEARGSTLRTVRVVLESYKDAPLDLPKLILKKLATFSNTFEMPDNASFYFFRDRLGILKLLPVFPCLLGIGGIGLCAALSRRVLRKEEGLLALVAILTPLAACLLVQMTSRYRAAMAGPLALGAGLFVVFTFESVRRGRMRSAFILGGAAGVLSLVPLLPSTIPAGRHRFADALVYATLVEGQGDLAGAAQEVRRYLEEGADDSLRDEGVAAFRHWYETGDRSGTNVAPEGLAPPERRLGKMAKEEGIRK
jgi:hypothetical protein